ncbi:hypothetical protein [Coraliomargarita parva]|uniref:hypothetical protein n=1 Tax=Coraliomargarita parva TaxID=3014050 RepID=UPI0022B3D537|nr:hypothetical protein [Coraliomargarita parva]
MDWVRSVDDEGKLNPSDQEIKAASTVYLVDEVMTGTKEEIVDIMERSYLEIAIQEFAAWWTVEEDWPLISDLKEFEGYFKWKLIEMIMDTTDQAYETEEV